MVPSWHPADSDSGLLKDDESTKKVHNDAIACFFWKWSFGIWTIAAVFGTICTQPRWLSGLKRSHVHSLMIARRSLCPEKLGSNPGQGSKGINFSGWHGLDM